jgi:hypothetical protein
MISGALPERGRRSCRYPWHRLRGRAAHQVQFDSAYAAPGPAQTGPWPESADCGLLICEFSRWLFLSEDLRVDKRFA